MGKTSLAQVHASNATISSLPPGLVAVFVGATSGIGEAALKEFVKNAKKPKCYLVGRSGQAANRIIGECKSLNPDANYTVPGAVITPSFYGYNMTQAQMRRVLQELAAQAVASSDARSIIAKPGNFQEYPSFFDYFNSTTSSSSESVADSLMSSRLLGRAELSELPTSDLKQHLQRLLEHSPFILLGLQGGRGPRNVPTELGGAVNPIWRRIYAHALSFGTPINTTGVPSVELKKAGQWAEVHPEAVWREWAPDTGAYMNEANCFNSHWKHDFYGVYYDELLDVKRKYDPTGSLYVISGVGSDEWEYDLHSGLLCRVD